jgi:ribonucleoside-diphosphate reductase alpha chain
MEIINFEDVKSVTAEGYFSGDKYAVDIFNTKYAMIKTDGTKETPAEVFYRVAKGLSVYELSQESQDNCTAAWFTLMWNGWFRPGGSILSSIGLGRKSSTMNCTTIPLGDDTLEAIAQCEYDVMKCAAYRQGIGIDFSKLRPRGSKLGNAAIESTGVIPWMDKLNRIGDYVGQQGRKPALLESLIISHPDIEEFITCKDDITKINNANISVQITNDFMEAVEKDADWEMSFTVRDSGEVIKKTIKAKKLFRLIADRAWKTAEPGIQYRNLLQNSVMYKAIADHFNDDRFLPHSSNACSEKFMAPYSVCNLSSLNMEHFSTAPKEYVEQLNEIVPAIVRMADNVVAYELDKNLSPLSQQRWIIEQLREVGMGITNVHGWLLKQDVAYDSDDAVKAVENFMKIYASIVFRTSVALGLEKGSAPAFELVEDKTVFMGTTYFRNIVNEFYNGDASAIKTMRNMAHMSIAPAGSLSSIFPSPCISSGIEPVIGLYYWRRTRAIDKGNYIYYFTIPQRLLEYILNKIDKASNDYEVMSSFQGSIQDEDGKIGKALIEIINKYIPAGFFKPAHEINPMQKIKLMSAVYKWMDASISCTYNLPASATIEDVENIYMQAYKNDVRAVSVYRDGSRQGILIFEDPITNKAKFEGAGKTQLCKDNRPKFITPVCAPKRLNELSCNIHHCSIKGQAWLVLVGLLENQPYELFCGQVNDDSGLYIPKTCKSGKIIKRDGGKYSLEIMVRNQEIEYKDLAHTLMDSEQRSITRLLSLAMRHGTPLEFIVDQLKKANGDITAYSTVIARVLSSYVKEYKYSKEQKCPQCGEGLLIRKEGCISCSECAYSKCG